MLDKCKVLDYYRGMNKPHNQQRDEKIISDLRLGIPAAVIARKHGITRARVSQIAWAAGIYKWAKKLQPTN
jgi:hypothetical protein